MTLTKFARRANLVNVTETRLLFLLAGFTTDSLVTLGFLTSSNGSTLFLIWSNTSSMFGEVSITLKLYSPAMLSNSRKSLVWYSTKLSYISSPRWRSMPDSQ